MQGSSMLPEGGLVVVTLCPGGRQSTALRSAKIYLQQDNWPLANLNRIDESENTFARATVLDTRR